MILYERHMHMYISDAPCDLHHSRSVEVSRKRHVCGHHIFYDEHMPYVWYLMAIRCAPRIVIYERKYEYVCTWWLLTKAGALVSTESATCVGTMWLPVRVFERAVYNNKCKCCKKKQKQKQKQKQTTKLINNSKKSQQTNKTKQIKGQTHTQIKQQQTTILTTI